MTPLEQVLTEFKKLSEKIIENCNTNKGKISEETKELQQRRKELIELMMSWGMVKREIAREVGLSHQRIHQILYGHRRSHRDKPGELV